jgi:sugar lactone lactonase YvrE
MIYAINGIGVLYRYDPDGTVHQMIEGLTIPNGIT